jgi:hypothetical protein
VHWASIFRLKTKHAAAQPSVNLSPSQKKNRKEKDIIREMKHRKKK